MAICPTASDEKSSDNRLEPLSQQSIFWFGLRTYLHPSWLEPEHGLLIDNRILKADSPILAWNTAYPLLCKQFNLVAQLNDRSTEQAFWLDFLPLVVTSPDKIINTASLALLSNGKLLTNDNEGHELTDIQRRKILTLGLSLSLRRRCQPPEAESHEIAGLWLLYQSLRTLKIDGWQRVRLAFDKATIKRIEEEQLQVFSAATLRCLQRLWQMIHQLLFVVEKEGINKSGSDSPAVEEQELPHNELSIAEVSQTHTENNEIES